MTTPPTPTKDPVCGMSVTHTQYKSTYRKKSYYFCGHGCLVKFEKAPHHYTHPCYIRRRMFLNHIQKFKKYIVTTFKHPLERLDLIAPVSTTTNSATRTTYTCPMHPEVISYDPHASCPQCGMDLEPMFTPGTSTTTNTQERIGSRRLQIRFVFALILTLPVMLLEMLPVVRTILPIAPFLSLLLTTLILFGPGNFIFTRAVTASKNRTLNMFSLIALGTLTAYLYSCSLMLLFRLAPHWLPPTALTATGQTQLYFETTATIITLVILGQVLEDLARKRTSRALRSLMELSPTTALRIHHSYQNQALHPNKTSLPPEAYETILLRDIEKDDILLIQPGAKLPVDGTLLAGQSEVDEALLTGEAELVFKTQGSRLLGGTLNKEGAFTMRAEKVGHETFLSEIISLTERAQRSHPPVQDFTERVTRIFIPAVLLISLFSFGVWYYWGPPPALSYALLAFVSVLIVACPCALGLATPMAITVGMSRGAEQGVLIKDAVLLERFTQITLVAIDKTGTLTTGKPTLSATTPTLTTLTPRDALQLAASLETFSEHPLAHAFKTATREKNIALLPVTNFTATPGAGITGTIQTKTHSQTYSIGSPRMLQTLNLPLPTPPPTTANTLTTTLFLTDHAKILATFSLSDTLKPAAKTAIAELKNRNLKVVLLSGDRQANCDEAGTALALDEVHGELRPQDKFEKIKAFKRAGHTVLMAGDGVNDAPALATADLSVAMGTGSDVALETAHATLLKGDLKSLTSLFTLSQKTLATIKSNLFFAFCYNTASIPIAAGILYPFWNITLSPMLAALLMILSSLSVIGNALRLRNVSL